MVLTSQSKCFLGFEEHLERPQEELKDGWFLMVFQELAVILNGFVSWPWQLDSDGTKKYTKALFSPR